MEGAALHQSRSRTAAICAGRWVKDFAARLEGKTVKGLGRRRQISARRSIFGEVLVMHLGMRLFSRRTPARQSDAGRYYHGRAPKTPRTDHVVFHMSSGARISFNDPRRSDDEARCPRRA